MLHARYKEGDILVIRSVSFDVEVAFDSIQVRAFFGSAAKQAL